MIEQSAASKQRSRRYLPVVILMLLAGVIAVARLHTYHEPMERDLATYLLIGREMLNGRELYSDLWNHKPPAIHATYAAAVAIAGPGPGRSLSAEHHGGHHHASWRVCDWLRGGRGATRGAVGGRALDGCVGRPALAGKSTRHGSVHERMSGVVVRVVPAALGTEAADGPRSLD